MTPITTLAISLSLWFSLQAPAPGEDPLVKSRRAEEALRSGHYAEAISLYQELVSTLPGLPGLKMNLGMAYYMAGQFGPAIQQLETAVGQDSSLTAAWLYLGASYLEMGNPAQAVRPLQQYVAAQAQDPQGRLWLGNALLEIEDPEGSAVQFEALAELEPKNPRTWYGLGRSYEALAVESFDRLDEIAPESAYWLALVAESRVAQQQFESAFFLYREALKKKSDLRGIHIALSHIYQRTGHPEWAETEKQKEMALGVPDCESEKAVCDFLEGKFHQVVRSVREEKSVESYYWLSQAYNQLALSAYSQLSQLPPSAELHELKAQVHGHHKDYAEAVREWRRVLDLVPGHPFARRELAISLALTREYQAALSLVQDLLEEEPRSAQLNFLAGDILTSQQRFDEGIPFLEKAVESDPKLLAAHSALGRAYLSSGDPARAIPHLQSALPLDADGSLHYQLARAHQRTGNREAAQELLSKYQEIQKSRRAEQRLAEEETKITPP